MLARSSLLNSLAAIVGSDHVEDDGSYFAVDGAVPQAIVYPGAYEQVAMVMRYANDAGLAVIPIGERNQMYLGNVPRRYDIALSLTRLDRIIEHEPADLTATCQAGIRASKLNQLLAEHGQVVPFRGSITPFGTVGGMLAAGNHGSPRDFTIGMRVVTADGRITRAGGNVVKNVAGYDLCKLYIGSLGTLGVIVEATFRLQSLPQATEKIDFEFESVRAACDLVFHAEQQGVDVRDATVTKLEVNYQPIGGYRVHANIGGTSAAVERGERQTSAIAGHLGGQPFNAERLNVPEGSGVPDWILEGDRIVCSVRVLPRHTAMAFEALEKEGRSPIIIAWPTTGEIEATWLGVLHQRSLLERLRDIVTGLGGSLIVAHCTDELKPEIDVFGNAPPAFDLMRRVKQQFDPNGILSPGRFVGRL